MYCIYCTNLLVSGTGKSVTGAHLAYAFAVYNAQHAKTPSIARDGEQYARPVMYCGPSNKSVDRVLGENTCTSYACYVDTCKNCMYSIYL